MRLIILAITLLFLSGCSTLDRMVSAGVEANDNALIAAEFTICKAASIGSIMRRYGVSEDKAKAWKELCTQDEEAVPIIIGGSSTQ